MQEKGLEMETLTFLLTTSFYPPYHVGGACVHVKYLAEELARRGHNVHVVHSLDAYKIKRGNNLPAWPKKEFDNLHIHSLSSPAGKINPLSVYLSGSSLYNKVKFEGILKKVKPDVVHHHNISLLGYDVFRNQRNYLSLYTAHDYWLICPTSNLLKDKKIICTQKSCFACAIRSKRPPQFWRVFSPFKNKIKNIDLMIYPCNYISRRLSQEIDIKSVVIPNFVPIPPKNIVASKDKPYFLFVGMLEVHKGILKLIQLFKEVSSKIDANLIIVGNGSLRDGVKRFIEVNSLGERIIYKGFVDNEMLYSLYQGALALILPSIWPENAPLVTLEAISVGTPVIASNNGGLPEIIEKVDEKLVFKDFQDLRRILLNFSRKDLPQSFVKQKFEEYFSPNAFVERYFDAINSFQIKPNAIN